MNSSPSVSPCSHTFFSSLSLMFMSVHEFVDASSHVASILVQTCATQVGVAPAGILVSPCLLFCVVYLTFCLALVHVGYEELTCHCGGEVMLPPIPCGSRPPACSRPCARPHPCEHPGTPPILWMLYTPTMNIST